MAGFTPAATPPKDVTVVASDNLLIEDTGEANRGASSSYGLIKSIGVPSNRTRAVFRVTFTLKSQDSTNTANGQIRHNGVVLGAVHSTTSTTYVTFSEDLTLPGAGGKIELWAQINSNHAYSDNLSLKGDETEVDQEYAVVT